MEIFNPARGHLIKAIETPTPTQIQACYEQAVQAQKSWQEVAIKDRVAVIARFSELLQQQQEELAEVLTSEVGKPTWQSVNELRGAIERIQFFAAESEDWLKDEWMTREKALSEGISYEPLGVIANISAWNYPYLVGVNVFVPALIAGNAVLYKPSEYSTLTGLRIEALLREAGLPEHLFQAITGGKSSGETLLDLSLDGYFFTGSQQTGAYIYSRVAPKMVPCQLELGGKDPMYVTEDQENLESAAEAAVEGAFYNNGQSCCAVERIYVHQDVAEVFTEMVVQKTKALKIGEPTEEGVWIGPVTRMAHLEVLEEQVRDAASKGARILLGGQAIDRPGNYFTPTVIDQVSHDMKLMTDETFGPLIGIQTVKDDAEATALMQDTTYGLTAAVYTKTPERAQTILKAMDSGTVYWNCCDRVSANVPWAGRKHSGFGLTLSYYGIRAFTKTKSWQLRGNWSLDQVSN